MTRFESRKIVFETNQLTVRELALDDFPAFFEMEGNPNVHRFTGSPVCDEAAAMSSLRKCIEAYSKTDNDFWVWCIESKTSAEMVGTCAIVSQQNEIGYRILERFWGNGYASEICDRLIDHGLNSMNLPSVFAVVDVLNLASVKILEQSKLEFINEQFNEEENCVDRMYRLDREIPN